MYLKSINIIIVILFISKKKNRNKKTDAYLRNINKFIVKIDNKIKIIINFNKMLFNYYSILNWIMLIMNDNKQIYDN